MDKEYRGDPGEQYKEEREYRSNKSFSNLLSSVLFLIHLGSCLCDLCVSVVHKIENPSRANREGLSKKLTRVRYYPFTDSPWEKADRHHQRRLCDSIWTDSLVIVTF